MTFKKCERARMLCFLANFQGLSVFLLLLVSEKDYVRMHDNVTHHSDCF